MRLALENSRHFAVPTLVSQRDDSSRKIWVVARHQCGISALVPQTSIRGETSGDVVKCRLFSQAGKRLVSTFSRCPDWTNQDKLLHQQLVTRAITSLCTELKSQMTAFRMIAVAIRKQQDMNYIKFKPRSQSNVCHNNYNFVYFTLLFRTVFTAEPQEPGTLYHTTSGTLTVQFAISRKNFLITPCISLSLFMMSTPLPRPITVCVSIATLLGHWPACSIECVVDSFINVCPYSVCYFCFYCFHKCTVIIVSTVNSL